MWPACRFSRLWLGLTIVVTAPINLPAADSKDPSVVVSENDLQIRLLNILPASIKLPALKLACQKIAELAATDKLPPTRVMIFAEHPIVRDALADKTIQITAPIKGAPAEMFVPLSHHGNRIIVKMISQGQESYALYSLPDDAGIDLKSVTD